MPSLPTEWSALFALVFVLGLRHGIDADHIATIDALTRLQGSPQQARGRWHGRWCGALFALGHGAVVLAVVAALAGVAGVAGHWQPPVWLAPLGSAVSITVLAALGVANLRAVLASAPGQAVALCSLRGAWFTRRPGARHPLAAAAVGAVFALSFDTMALAAMFALSGTAAGGMGPAVALALAFAAGMLLTDGGNGWWLARLLARGGAGAARASRATAALVAVVSLGMAALGLARWLSPTADAWADGAGGCLGAALLAAVLGTTTALLWRQRHKKLNPASAGGASETNTTPSGA